MTPLADLIRQLGAAGCSIEQIAVAVSHQENLMHESEQKKRVANADRQKRWRDRNVTRRNETLCNVSHSDIPPVDINTPPREKAKKLSLSVDVPETPSDGQKAYATGKGWDLAKVLSEWGRFRDWSLNKGRKHKNIDAAWRNWVTSPYQVSGASNGRPVQADKSVVAAADKILERMRSFDRPVAEDRRGDSGFTSQNPRRLLSQG